MFKKTVDIQLIRKDFPFLSRKIDGRSIVYLDSAATTQKPKVVIQALSDFYLYHYSSIHRGIYQLATEATDLYDKSRKKVKDFINAKASEEIVFTKGATESINLVASSFGKAYIKEGDEIIISQMEHHSNIVPWQIVSAERKAKLQIIPINRKGEIIFEKYLSLLSKRTKLVSIAHVANSTGSINPIKEVIEEAHRFGARVLIDGAQAVAHMEVDVQMLDADFYVFSGHKMYGPTGVGVLYGKKDLLDSLPPYQTGGGMIQQVSLQKSTYLDVPLRFEAGTPMIAEVIALKKALDYIQEIGRKNIRDYENALLTYATEKLQEIERLKIIGTSSNKGAIISFIVSDIHPLDLGKFLDFKNIAIRTGHHCAWPALSYFNLPATVRISFGIYNTVEEIEYFVDSLKEVMKDWEKLK